MKTPRRALIIALIILGFLAGKFYTTWQQYEMNFSMSGLLLVSHLQHDIVTCGDTGQEKLAALTFDDGPDPRFTGQILDILKKYKVQATFFVVGESCGAYPHLLRREITAGHEVQNHTFTHPDLVKDAAVSTEEEILRTHHAIEVITGREPCYFRPPRRLFTAETIDIADMNGYKVVLWTIGLENRKAKTPRDMAERVIKAAQPGIIILAHDGILDRSKTVAALPLLIEGYQKKGYRFVKLKELLSYQSEPNR